MIRLRLKKLRGRQYKFSTRELYREIINYLTGSKIICTDEHGYKIMTEIDKVDVSNRIIYLKVAIKGKEIECEVVGEEEEV